MVLQPVTLHQDTSSRLTYSIDVHGQLSAQTLKTIEVPIELLKNEP